MIKIKVKYFILSIFVIAFAVYGNSLSNGFVWDDTGQIVQNPSIQNLTNVEQFFTTSTFYSGGATNLGGIYYKPLLSTSFALNLAIWGLNPFGFHLFSILLHFLNTSLVFLLFLKLFRKEKFETPKLLAFLLSIIFLVHPTQVESVSYISSVQEILYLLFLLIALHLTIYFCESNKEGHKLLLINSAVLLSMLSKETGILSIFVVSIFVWLFNKSKIIKVILSLGATLAAYLFLRFGIASIGLGHAAAPPIANAPFTQRLLTIPFEVFSYLRLIFFPKALFISQNFIIKSSLDPHFYLTLPIDLIFIAIISFFLFKLKSKLYTFLYIWLSLSILIILNIFPLDFTIAERWLYGPLVPFLGILGVIISKITEQRASLKTLVIIVLLFSLFIFSYRTIIRNRDWKNNLTLISHDINLNPESYELQGDYGTLLFERGNLNGAKIHTEKALQLSPTWWVMYSNLADIYTDEGNIAKAKELYLIAIKNVNDPVAYQNLSVLKFKTEEPRSSVDFAIQALKYYPNNPTLNFIAALSYFELGDKINALSYAKIAYYLHPSTQTYTAIQSIVNNQSPKNLLK